MKIFLIGVDHRIQWIPKQLGPESSPKLKEFFEYLDNICSKNEITLITEEFREEAHKKTNAVDEVDPRQIHAETAFSGDASNGKPAKVADISFFT